MDSILGLLAVFLLVFMNGFFVAAEFSLVGARRTRIAQMAAEGSAGAKSAQNAIHHLDSYIAATQLGITLASLGLGWIGEPAVGHLIEPIFHAILPEASAETVGRSISIAIAFAIVTMLHIVLGELAPKTIALQRPESTSVLVARPTTWFLNIFRPVIYVMNSIGNAVVRLLGFEPVAGHSAVHTAEELEMLVQSSREAGVLQESEEILLRRVFDFSDIYVEEIMQPRVEVDAIALDMPLAEMLELIAARHHSRFPVYRESMDNVVGVLLVKDLLDALVQQPQLLADRNAVFQLQPILREPLFVPGTLTVDKLLEKMQQTKTHLAIVIDEYGGMAGVATMEDIIEQLVGEVQDEFDVETSPIEDEGDVAVVDGLVSMTEATDRFGDPGGEPLSTTIGGYVAERLGRIPATGDKVTFSGYDLCVEEMDGMRVAKVRFVRRGPKPNSNVSENSHPPQ
jgi:CBS domain containing-hemolysin-like protein